MAKFPILIEGYDPTSVVTDITRPQLLAMVHESEHVDYVGPIVHAVNAPNVSLYPKLKYFIWHKLSSDLVGTGELYFWSSTEIDWLPLKPSIGSLSGEMIADGTITLAKLDATGLVPLTIVRVNAAGDAFETVSIDNILLTNSIPLNKLVNAGGEGYVVFSGTDGVWTAVFWNALFEEALSNSLLPVANLRDLDDVGLLDQILRRTVDGHYEHEYADQLLRANQVPTDRLQYAAGMAGKFVKVNALGTDIEGATAVTAGSTAAVLKYTATTGTAGQVVSASVATTIQWDAAAIDPDVIVTSLVANQFTLATGTYLLDVYVPISNPGTDTKFVIVLRDVTAANALLAVASTIQGGDADDSSATLKHVIKITASSNVYDVQIFADQACELGSPVNLGTYAETYQQMSIIKLV